MFCSIAVARASLRGRFGFHSNLPKEQTSLSPLSWLRMARDVLRMPKFDAMVLTLESKSVLGFNLSFFADEKELCAKCAPPIMQSTLVQ